MKLTFLKGLKNEDWVATILGSLLLLLVVMAPDLFKNGYVIFASIAALSLIGQIFLGNRAGAFLISFSAIYLIALGAQYVSAIPYIKHIGIESVFFSVAVGLIIRNMFGLPKWLEPAVRSEFFIKAGLVLLGSSVLISEIMRAGSLGMLQAIIVVIAVWYFSFWISRKMGVDKEMGVMLSSAVSICGVSAAIATCGAIKGDSKKLSFVVSIVLIVAIPMMYLMPWLANMMGLSQEVAGAWLGGTIDTTGAVVASGKFLGDIAEKYSVIIKSSQNVLLGIAAFAISIYWSYRGTNSEIKPTPSLLWERFPKFVIGFVAASLLFSVAFDPQTAKDLGKVAKGMREILFSVAFVAIGLETNFREIFNKSNRSYTSTFLIAQTFNIIVTLTIAWLLFS